jgi:hypothetical protein
MTALSGDAANRQGQSRGESSSGLKLEPYRSGPSNQTQKMSPSGAITSLTSIAGPPPLSITTSPIFRSDVIRNLTDHALASTSTTRSEDWCREGMMRFRRPRLVTHPGKGKLGRRRHRQGERFPVPPRDPELREAERTGLRAPAPARSVSCWPHLQSNLNMPSRCLGVYSRSSDFKRSCSL